VTDVANALHDVAAQLNADLEGTSDQKTPQWQTAAIRVAANDHDQPFSIFRPFSPFSPVYLDSMPTGSSLVTYNRSM
jgi:hypothetical protein